MADHDHHHAEHCMHEIDIGMIKQSILNTDAQLKKVLEILEKQAKLEEKSQQLEHMVSSMDKRLRYVEAAIASYNGSSKWTDKLLWAVLSALVSGGVVFQVLGK